MDKNVVILADGNFPSGEYALNLLKRADRIICCDASVLKLERYTDLKCYRIVGDMDTLPEKDQERLKEIIVKYEEQETNDLNKAFRFATRLEPQKITILGATGEREDHTLGNISLLADFAQKFKNIELVTDYGIFKAFFDTFSMEAELGAQISIFPLDTTLKIKSHGLLYKTDNVVFDRWWKATLNEVVSSPFTLELSHPASVLVYQVLDNKKHSDHSR